jgi:pimeloyl-ACP methyl ester carboxylesterase
MDFHGLPFRETAEKLVKETMDALDLQRAIVIGHSMGGYFALVFALAHPDRVTKLVLIGESAGSSPPGEWRRLAASQEMTIGDYVSMDETRHDWGHVIAAHIERVSTELMEAFETNKCLNRAHASGPKSVIGWRPLSVP